MAAKFVTKRPFDYTYGLTADITADALRHSKNGSVPRADHGVADHGATVIRV